MVVEEVEVEEEVGRWYNGRHCRGAEMADRLVSKTSEGNLVRVRLPLPAHNIEIENKHCILYTLIPVCLFF